MQDARNLARFGGMRPDRDNIQIDPGLGHGLTECPRTLAAIEAEGFSRRSVIPHGRHEFGLSPVAGLGPGGNEPDPEVSRPFGGFADWIQVGDGEAAPPEVPPGSGSRRSRTYSQ